MKKCNKFYYRLTFIIICFVLGSVAISVSGPKSLAKANGIKLYYNGKTYINRSKKMSVTYQNKTISKKAYPAVVINKNYMAAYDDVFMKGMNISCKYDYKGKILILSANGITLKMQIGKKTAYKNGKKVKLKAAPVSVRFVAKKKTKILIPINYVAKTLRFSYIKSGTTIQLAAPLQLTYDGKLTYYTGTKGNIYYNHTKYSLHSIPVVKLFGRMYLPAEEVLSSIMGLTYSYNETTKELIVNDADLNQTLRAALDSKQAKLNNKTITLSAAPKMIYSHKTKQKILCIPAASILGRLNYTRSWNKKLSCYSIQNKEFFSWSTKTSTAQQTSSTTNYLYAFKSFYQKQKGTGSISVQLSGTNKDIMKTATVKRNGNVISISLPKSSYLLGEKSFKRFGEIIQSMNMTTNGTTVTLTFTCYNTADFSYIIHDKILEINILRTYQAGDGSVTNYSLSIPRPKNIHINQVRNQDLYLNKKFQIIIPGDYVSYYQSKPIIINHSSIKKIMIAKSGQNTVITVTTASLVGYKIYEKGNTFSVLMGQPNKIFKNVLVLDAGHGGHDPGAQNKGTNEKKLTHKIIYTLMKDKFSGNAPDTKVYWTRTTDTFVTLAKRAAFAKSVSADAFISLHMNSADNRTANGTEVYYSVSNNKTSFSGISSKAMANLFRKQLLSDLKTTNRGTKTAAYYVLKHNTVPAILIELGFISGNGDYSKLTNTTFQKKAANSIYKSIQAMFQTYPTGR